MALILEYLNDMHVFMDKYGGKLKLPINQTLYLSENKPVK